MDTTRRINLRRYIAEANLLNYGAYRLRVEVEEVRGEGLDEFLFIYHRHTDDPYTGANRDVFEAVAGPAQLRDYPINVPDPDQGWPMYRKNFVEIDFISARQAEEFWLMLRHDADMLCEALNQLDRLVLVDDNWIPGPPEDGSSSSASQP